MVDNQVTLPGGDSKTIEVALFGKSIFDGETTDGWKKLHGLLYDNYSSWSLAVQYSKKNGDKSKS